MGLLSEFAALSGWYVLAAAVLIVTIDIFLINTEVLLWFGIALAIASAGHFAGLGPNGILITYALALATAAASIVIRQNALRKNRPVEHLVPQVGDNGVLILPDYSVTTDRPPSSGPDGMLV